MAVWKNWEDLTIADDYMFKLVMSHKRICKHLLEMILGIKIRELREPEAEKSVKNSYENDGTSKIFLSTKGTMDDVVPDVRSFLDFVDGVPVQDSFVSEVSDLINKLKTDEREKANYMTFQMKINEERAEARNEGHAEGLAEGESRLSRLISLLLKSGKTEEAMAATESEAARKELYTRYGIA